MAAKRNLYSERELYSRGPQITYSGRNLDEIAFPLGGIGTGMITLGGWGQLRDFEIQNRPAKGNFIRNSFFAMRVRQGKTDVTRALQGPVEGAFGGDGHSVRRFTGEGLPHFRKVTFRGEYPFAWLEISDPAMPVKVALEAWNPFIPLDDKDSSIPVAILSYTVRNASKRGVDVTLFGSTSNIIGGQPTAGAYDVLANAEDALTRENLARHDGGVTGLYMTNRGLDAKSPRFGSMALAAVGGRSQVLTSWVDDRTVKIFEGVAWADGFPPKETGTTPTGTIAVSARIPAGKSATVTFVIAWHFPNFERYWGNEACACGECGTKPPVWKNWYAGVWNDAWDVASYVAREFGRLRRETLAFHDALFSSTLPAYVLDAVSANMSILKTPTCIRATDGTFYGFEGCNNTTGCCEGSCTHVWNYAQALPYLFPALQRSQREADYKYAHSEDGQGQFRIPLPLGTKADFKYHPAADGQMGAVCQVYREYLVSGDAKWLESIWPATKRALEFAWKFWDADRDGVMEGVQHNTYDIEFYGPNTMVGSLYLAALLAGEKMAQIVGDGAAASEYRRLFEKGSAWTGKNLWNGEYYEQKVAPDAHRNLPDCYRELTEKQGRDDKFPWPKWQYGKGCLADHMIGQWYAEMLGLGKLYNARKVRRALLSIFKYNWRSDLTDHPGLLRLYALRDETGLVICTWPKGGRPGYPVVYCDEIWCGIEYQVASHLIYEGLVDEGLSVTKGVRERHRGDRRNPWDEFECGHHYARSMASYAVMTALAGFHYDGAAGKMSFAPRIFEKDFRVFVSVGTGWGTFAQKFSGRKRTLTLEAAHGAFEIGELSVALSKPLPKSAKAAVGGASIEAAIRRTATGASVVFDEKIRVEAGCKLVLTLT